MAINLLLALTILWNIALLVGGVLFYYFGYVVRDDFVVRRYPALSLLQLVSLSIWINLLLQRCQLHLTYGPTIPLFARSMVHGILLPVFGPLNISCFVAKGFSLTVDLFQTRRMIFESQNKKAFDWKQNLNRLERMFFRMQAWILRDSVLQARRYPAQTMYRGMVISTLISLFILVPTGMWWGECLNPDVGWDACTAYPYYQRFYTPMNILFTVYALAIPMLVFMLRSLNDPLYLREETAINYLLLIIVYISYLVILYFDVPTVTDPLRAFLPPLIGVPWTLVTMYYLPVFFSIRNRLEARKKELNVEHNLQSFQRILKDRHMFEELKAVMSANFALENALFWEDLMAIEKLYATSTAHGVSPEALDPLLRLYAEYIPAGSARELNLLSSTRSKVVADFRAGSLTLNTFATVRKEVQDMMYLNSFPQLVRALKARRDAASGLTTGKNSLLSGRSRTSTSMGGKNETF